MGVTSLDNHLYVLRGNKSSEQIEVYDIDSYRLVHSLTVPELGIAFDIVACGHNRCAYISDLSQDAVRRVALSDTAVTQWPVNDEPAGLSLSYTHSVLVTCRAVRKIKDFSTDGQLLHVLTLPEDVVSPRHAVQLSSGQFIVCHGYHEDPSQSEQLPEVPVDLLTLPQEAMSPWLLFSQFARIQFLSKVAAALPVPPDRVHRVCLLGSDGSVVKSFGGPKASSSQQMNVPFHMAVDRNGFVFVLDLNKDRVLLLSPSLTHVCDVVSRKQCQWGPVRVHVDSDRGRLYVADNEFKDDKFTAGRVIVVSV